MATGEPPAKKACHELWIASRDSALAMVQSRHVASMLEKAHPHLKVGIKSLKTLGDKVLNKPLPQIGEKGLFTKELEAALHGGGVHLAVHSLKDVPTASVDGLVLGAILEREKPEDAVVVRSDLRDSCKTLADLPAGSTVGTSSLRRQAMLKSVYPHLTFKDVRGNLQTRFRKLEDPANGYSALVLALSGLIRMELDSNVSQILDAETHLYAPGQGALAVQCRGADEETLQYLKPLHHERTASVCSAERTLMRHLEGGCHVPLGVNATCIDGEDPQLELSAVVHSKDGKERVKETRRGPLSSAERLGELLAEAMKLRGAARILAEHRTESATA